MSRNSCLVTDFNIEIKDLTSVLGRTRHIYHLMLALDDWPTTVRLSQGVARVLLFEGSR
jgi:hypothetical protein